MVPKPAVLRVTPAGGATAQYLQKSNRYQCAASQKRPPATKKPGSTMETWLSYDGQANLPHENRSERQRVVAKKRSCTF
jgi:hypothetical protein